MEDNAGEGVIGDSKSNSQTWLNVMICFLVIFTVAPITFVISPKIQDLFNQQLAEIVLIPLGETFLEIVAVLGFVSVFVSILYLFTIFLRIILKLGKRFIKFLFYLK